MATPNQAESLEVVKLSLLIANHTIYYLCIQDYPDFYQMYDALVEKREVEGILADIYTASYYMGKIDDPRLVVSMILSSERSIGLVISHKEQDEDLAKKGKCLRELFKYRERDIKKIILKHTHAFHVS